MKGLAPKITLAFIFAIIVTLLLYSLILNQAITDRFDKYVHANVEATNKKITAALATAYSYDGKWTPRTGLDMSAFVIQEGIGLRVRDIDNHVVWNSMSIHHEVAAFFLVRSNTDIRTFTNPITINNNTVGYVEIFYIGDIQLNTVALTLKNSINMSLISTAIFSTIFAIFLSIVFSSGITMPLTRTTQAAMDLAAGDLRQRLPISTANDELTELSRAINHLAETLEKEADLRKKLTADIAHELRTPLMTLQLQLEAIIDGLIEPSKETLENCQSEVVRLSSLIGDMEQLSSADRASLELKLELLSLTDITKAIYESFIQQAEQKNIAFTYYSNKPCYIEADRSRLTQIIVNLISNAIKYSQSGDSVSIKITHNYNVAILAIKDTGLGISKEDLPLIFERFYRGEKSRNRDTGGSGIGLAIVKSLIDAHNWDIDVNSELDIGTEFVLYIPIIEQK